MSKQKWKFVLLVAFSIGCLHACMKEELVSPIERHPLPEAEKKGLYSADIEAMKLWLQENEQQLFMTKSGEVEENKLFSDISPQWEWAYVTYDSKHKLKTVEVPIASYERTLFVPAENEAAYMQMNDARYITSLTYLILCLDEKSGEIMGFFMTQVPSKAYLDKTEFKSYTSTYLSRAKDFDGSILFHDMHGEFLNGWKYENGVIVEKYLPIENALQTKGGYWKKKTVCVPVYVEVREEMYYTVESGGYVSGPHYNGDKVTYEYVGDYCYIAKWWIDTGDDDYKPGGGGGGSADVGVTNPPKEVEPRLMDCSELGIESASRANDLWVKFERADIENQYLNYYQDKDIEYGLALLLDTIRGSCRFSDLATGIEDYVNIQYKCGENEICYGTIHNHPSSKCPSIQDLWSLIKKCNKSKGKSRHSIIAAKNGTILDLQIVDTTKAYSFLKEYSALINGKDTLSPQKKAEWTTMLSEAIKDIIAVSDTPDDCVNPDDYYAEWTYHGFVYLCNRKQAGVVLLQLIDGEFKMLGAEEERVIVNQDTVRYIYRQRCK